MGECSLSDVNIDISNLKEKNKSIYTFNIYLKLDSDMTRIDIILKLIDLHLTLQRLNLI